MSAEILANGPDQFNCRGRRNVRNDPLSPSAALLVKLGSLVIHLEEAHSPNGHPVDHAAVKQLQDDPEVQAWFAAMHKMAMLAVKR